VNAPLRVLLVEDQPADARLVALALGGEGGAEVAQVDRVAGALARLADAAFDAVLLDLGLPDSHHLDGLERIRRAAPSVPVVVLSGSEDPARRRDALEAGAQAYEVKRVFPKGVLGRLLREAIVLRRIEETLARGDALSPADRGALSGLSEGVAVVDRGRFTTVNHAAARLLAAARTADPDAVAHLFRPSVRGAPPPKEAGPPTAYGELLLAGPDGRRATARYVRTILPHGTGLRVLVRLSEVPPPEEPTPAAAPAAGRALPRPPGRGSRAHRGTGAERLPPAIDRRAWDDLAELAQGDATFLPSAVSLFLDEGERRLRELEAAATRRDLAALEQGAHALKSASAEVAALRLSRILAQVEAASSAGRSDDAVEFVRGIEPEFRRVAAALRARVAPK
jgi:CheY-like chemotaxis protein